MVDPVFSNDYHKFVLQDPSIIPLPPVGIPKLFFIPSSEKTKKEMEKEKSLKSPKPINLMSEEKPKKKKK